MVMFLLLAILLSTATPTHADTGPRAQQLMGEIEQIDQQVAQLQVNKIKKIGALEELQRIYDIEKRNALMVDEAMEAKGLLQVEEEVKHGKET